MRLSAPKFRTWLVAVILGVLGIIVRWIPIGFLDFLPQPHYWLLVAGFVILALGSLLRKF
jgi:H+/Cl- antiporter ClcA